MPNSSQQVGQNVRGRREALGLSARKLAHLAGIDNGTLLRIEHGQITQPRRHTLKAIDTALKQWSATDQPLPPLTSYLRARYPQVSERVVKELADYFDYLTARYGDATSADGADER
ncbi:MAG: hypothetical protein QOH56_2712 [Pseudonocardiales bacterium]|nr:hypothetical protein [Pseudonocardiales bacterium]